MTRIFFVSIILLFSNNAFASLIVHEWGTFTSVLSSNGKAQAGMYQEDEALPDFVYNFGTANWPQNTASFLPAIILPPPGNDGGNGDDCPGSPKIPCDFLVGKKITQKMETPVVYFYSDTAKKVQFDVSFPEGIISQSFPAPTSSFPAATPGVDLLNGFASYQLEILVNSQQQPPYVSPENIYSHARNTKSKLIKIGKEIEKFIFYRGLGSFNAELKVSSKNGKLFLHNSGLEPIQNMFLIHTDANGSGNILELTQLKANASQTISKERVDLIFNSSTQEHFIQSARTKLTKALTNAGLYRDEALSMVDTWENGYFQTPGLRILYILNNKEVERILPIRVKPQPDELKRVFVGRLEILLDTQENELLQKLITQGENFPIESLGSNAYPILLRLVSIAKERSLYSTELKRAIVSLKKRL